MSLSNESNCVELIYGLQRALDLDSTTAYSVLCHPKTSHLRSQFSTIGWGCGYHNAQMLLSYLSGASKEEYKKAFGEEIPSIRKLQTLIEAGWAKGWHLLIRIYKVVIDIEGAAQLRNSLCILLSERRLTPSGHS